MTPLSDPLWIVLLTLGCGLCMALGGVLASLERIRPDWLDTEFRHFMIALGGGILLGAVVQVLLPWGMHQVGDLSLGVACFVAGGVAFFGLERMLGMRRRERPQLMGMLLDYLPESVALGGMVASGSPLATTLAVLIGLQNVPEGFNAYRELVGQRPMRTLAAMASLALLGPVAGLAGYGLLGGQPQALGVMMLVASGGILYLMFQDIAPQSHLNHHWAPPLGAVLGFAITMAAQAFSHGA
jgi:zinc transporter, ZIP family